MVAEVIDLEKSELLKVTVITVCFNAGKKISKTIKSVLEQSYLNIEYIIIDGGSTDDTKDIVAHFGTCISNFISEPDKGLYDAMNKGVLNATGELLIFLNAGDYFVSKDVIEFYIPKMKMNEADLFFGRIVWNDPKHQIICLSDHQKSRYTWDLKNSNFPHPATVYKKKLFDKIGLFNLNYPIAADYEWNVRALVFRKEKFQYIDIIVTVFFADGISNNEALAQQHYAEIEEINKKYYKPWKLYKELEESKPSFFQNLLKKFAGKFLNFQLARVY